MTAEQTLTVTCIAGFVVGVGAGFVVLRGAYEIARPQIVAAARQQVLNAAQGVTDPTARALVDGALDVIGTAVAAALDQGLPR